MWQISSIASILASNTHVVLAQAKLKLYLHKCHKEAKCQWAGMIFKEYLDLQNMIWIDKNFDNPLTISFFV